jgi:RND family efflux transporter MFP subunit
MQMSSKLKIWLIPVLAVAGLLLIIAWMAGTFRDRIEPGNVTRQAGPPPEAELFTIQAQSLAVTEAVPATIEAKQATTISSRILARITRIEVRAGDTVKQGQLLLELERSDLESRASQAQEQVRAITARLTEARQSLERSSQLQEQGLVAAAVLDEARASHDALTAELATAKQAVKEAEVAISFTRILSPIDGRIIDRFAEPGDTAAPGDRLLSLYNPLSLRIESAVREGLAMNLQLGQKLEVEIPALETTLPAVIEELVPAADPGSRSFMVKARVDFDGRLLPGMYARLKVPAGTEWLILIPLERVTSYGQLDVVWVLHEDSVERRFIRRGRTREDGFVEVIAGLSEGDRLAPVPNPVGAGAQ